MNLKKFSKNKKLTTSLILLGLFFLIGGGFLIYRTFALYSENKEFNVIKGRVPEFIKGLKSFDELKTYAVPNYCIDHNIVQVSHESDYIEELDYHAFNSSLTNETVYNNLKMPEYRFCGSNPNNYVTFNGEVAGWRIIGLVNTPEGQRIKLVRANPLDVELAWDNKAAGVGTATFDYGSNDWTDAALQELLNKGAYYLGQSGNCPLGQKGGTIPCDFSESGLTDNAKEMIDTITWNLGGYYTQDMSVSNADLVKNFYEYERGKGTYRYTSNRPLMWQGKIGLLYLSDYGYAAGGMGKEMLYYPQCMATPMFNWGSNENYIFCLYDNWLNKENLGQWLLMPDDQSNFMVWYYYNKGQDSWPYSMFLSNVNDLYEPASVIPTLYLKPNVEIKKGNGTIEYPYELTIKTL